MQQEDSCSTWIGWLKLKGWKCIRLQSGLVRGHTRGTMMRLGELGLPDWICVKGQRCFFLELKARGKKLRPAQEAWLAEAIANGTSSFWTDDFEEFKTLYKDWIA